MHLCASLLNTDHLYSLNQNPFERDIIDPGGVKGKFGWIHLGGANAVDLSGFG